MSLEQHSTPLGATSVAYGTPLKCTPSGHSLQKAYIGCPRVKPLSIICSLYTRCPLSNTQRPGFIGNVRKLKLTIKRWRSCKQQDACSEVEIMSHEWTWLCLNPKPCQCSSFFLKQEKLRINVVKENWCWTLLAKGYNLIFNITWPQRPLHLQSGYGMDCVRTSDNLWTCLWETYVLHFSFFYQLLHCSHLLHHTACWINTHPLPPVSNDRKYVKRMDRER